IAALLKSSHSNSGAQFALPNFLSRHNMIFNHPFAQALAAALLSFFFATSLICAESDSPRTLESQLADAAAAEGRADYAAARKIYSQATADYPASSEAWAALG